MANIFNLNNISSKDNNIQNEVEVLQTPGLNAAAAFRVVGSIASEENALAAVIQEEADKLTLLAGETLTFANFTTLTGSIVRAMKIILLKNTVLEAKLTETLNYIDIENFTLTSAFVDNITAIFNSIANEENALGNLIRALGNAVRLLAPTLSIAQLQAVDQIVISLMRVITEKNLVLLSKLRRLVRFVVNNSAAFPIPSAAQVAATIAAINALINSITVEENGLAVLIEGEAVKLSRAVALTTTAAGIAGLLAFNTTITSVLDIIVQKNMILEAKLEDILALLALGFTPAQLAAFAVTLSNLQQSIANEENALASLLEAQVNLLCNAINPCINVCDFIDAIQSIIRTLKAIIQKNNVLENKLGDTLSFIQNEGIDCLDCNNQFKLLNNLNSVLESIGTEEFSLGCLIGILGKSIENIVCYCTFDDIKQVNNLVVTLMRLIVNLNTILLRELRTVVSLIKFIKDSNFDIFIKIKKDMLCIIKNLIDSIFKEEEGLAELIFGESVKINCALNMCLNEEELLELDSLVTSFIDVICDKRQILEFKLSEVLSLLNTVGFGSCKIDFIMDHIKELQTIASKNKFELSKLIKDNSKELNEFIDKKCCNFQELIDINICITNKFVSLLNNGCKIKNAECNSCSPCNCNNKIMGNY